MAELLVGPPVIDELGVRPKARGTGPGRRPPSTLTATAAGGRA
ncbi:MULTISPECIES: hypothetical protein [Streptomyces]|nr:hypothetical protein [Streptomyces sp. NEAU-HV9]